MEQLPTFGQIYKEYRPKIYSYLSRLLNDREEAEDLTQEVFIRVNNNLASFRGDSKLSTWIYKIANNISIDRFRSSAYRNRPGRTIGVEFGEDSSPAVNVWTGENEQEPYQQVAVKEMNSCIKRYIDDLDENYRAVILMSEYEGLKNQEIADILGISLDSVKIRIHRARTQLKKKMQNGCEISAGKEGNLSCNEL